jgi:hypothetical protein
LRIASPLDEREVTQIALSIGKYPDPKETRRDDAERLTTAVLRRTVPDSQNGRLWNARHDGRHATSPKKKSEYLNEFSRFTVDFSGLEQFARLIGVKVPTGLPIFTWTETCATCRLEFLPARQLP